MCYKELSTKNKTVEISSEKRNENGSNYVPKTNLDLVHDMIVDEEA